MVKKLYSSCSDSFSLVLAMLFRFSKQNGANSFSLYKRFASNKSFPPVTGITGSKSKDKSSSGGSPFDSSFSFQLFMIVGAMGAGYTLGKSTIMSSPPPTLFPKGSTTSYEDLKEFDDSESTTKAYDKFKRCILRILEAKGIDVDVKHGQNEILFDEKYCNEHIAAIMNDIDGVGDLFFGKKEEIWDGKEFKWFPESTEDVSNILKLSNEFVVPTYTTNFGEDSSGLCFKLDFSRMNKVEVNEQTIDVAIGANNEDILKTASMMEFSGTALDIMLQSCGVATSDMTNRCISTFATSHVKEFTAVLPDGTVINATKDRTNPEQFKLFQLLSQFQNELCVITHLKLESPHADNSKLVVIGTNSSKKLHEYVTEISKKIPDTEISIIDNFNCQSLADKYGEYKSYCVFKAGVSDLYRLNKRYSSGEETTDSKIACFTAEQVYANQPSSVSQYYVLAENIQNVDVERSHPATSGLLVTENVHKSNFRRFILSSGLIESTQKTSGIHNVLRRVKLSVDPDRIVNRGLLVATVAADN